jgi:hypothetical protein
MATDIEAITATLTKATGVGKSFTFRDLFPIVIPFKVTLEEDSIAASLASQVDVTVPGAALGDFVLIAPGVDSTQCVLTAHVTAANTLTVNLANQDATDASTAFATATVARGVVLRMNPSTFAELAA